jgi:hypothetical protein
MPTDGKPRSARGWGRVSGYSPDLIARAVRARELRARRPGGRRYYIDPDDFAEWVRSHEVRPTSEDLAVVESRLQREET